MALLNPVSAMLSNYIRAMTGSSDDAKDVMSETILQAYERFDELRKPESFRYYLFTIARRSFTRRLRRGKLFSPLTDHHGDTISTEQAGPDLAAEVRELYDAMDQLPADQREAVALFELSGFPLKDVARIQNCSLPAVKVRVMRGRKRLAELLDALEEPGNAMLDSTAGDADE